MDEFDLTTLKQSLLEWPSMALPQAGAAKTSLLARISTILEAGRLNGCFDSLPDLMVLVRQLLLSYSSDTMSRRLSVPRDSGWPDEDTWRTFGFDITKSGTRFLLEAKAWCPEWLGAPDDQAADLFRHEHRAQPVRRVTRVRMDPFLREVTGFKEYVCPGQREALLSALFMRPGDSLIVNLPTGSGKSLVAQAPVLVRGPNEGLTLVVVPTNSLGIDLARRTRDMYVSRDADRTPHELMWIGSRNDGSLEAIKQRLRSGSQGILFASPEAVCGSLLKSLYIAAEKGLIAYLVVDEAHLIAQWGDAFRPAFQQLSGVRRGLLNACPSAPFRTLLLSATFSRQVLETLKILFGPSEKLNIVSAVHLRPEPRYLCYQCLGPTDKNNRLEELSRYIPRPFIIYTTKREDAISLFSRLHQKGFRRIALVHGETPNEERERIIRKWVEDQLDGVVATSAFGVGMDKRDVRTVIHAALPETLDRFYQEVGRGGRDGCASLSITLFDKADIETARRMTAPTLIGDDKGYERWNTLYRAAEPDPQDTEVRVVDLRKRPGGLTQESDYNRDWNMRTLILLARAGLIQLESTRPLQVERHADEDEGAFQARVEDEHQVYFSQIPVRSLDPRLMDRSHFEQQLDSERRRGMESANRAFNQMLNALSGKQEMADVLVELLSSDDVVVSAVCRGCPAINGELHDQDGVYQIPSGTGISRLTPYDDQAWQLRFGDLNPSEVVTVFCPADTPEESILDALRASVSLFGVRELALMPSLRASQPAYSELHRLAHDQVLVLRDLDDRSASLNALPLPRATLLLPWGNHPFPDELLLLERPLHIVFAPLKIRDSHPLRLYRDTATNSIDLEDFLRRVKQ